MYAAKFNADESNVPPLASISIPSWTRNLTISRFPFFAAMCNHVPNEVFVFIILVSLPINCFTLLISPILIAFLISLFTIFSSKITSPYIHLSSISQSYKSDARFPFFCKIRSFSQVNTKKQPLKFACKTLL